MQTSHEAFGRAVLSCAVAGVVFAACGGSSTTSTVVAPTAASRCQASVTPSAPSFGPKGGAGTLSLGIPRDCA